MEDIILITHGSGGDVIPFIRLGARMKKIGYHVTLLTHCIYKNRVNQIDFIAIDTEEEYLEMSRSINELSNPIEKREEYLLFHRKYYGVNRTLREVELIKHALRNNNTIILFQHRFSMSGLLAGEKYGITAVSVFLAPNYLAHLQLHEQLIGKEMKYEMNQVRKKLDLLAIDSWVEWMCSSKYKIALWPDWYAKDEGMKMHGMYALGFCAGEEDNSEVISDEVISFCKEGGKTVLITAGTSRLIHHDFYRIAYESCMEAGMKALLVSEYDEFIPKLNFQKSRRLDHASIKELLKYVDVIIHHGGIGTSSEALEAGIPQLIMAHMLDRPDNANRLKHIGIAKVYPEIKWNTENISNGLKEIVCDRKIKEACERIKTKSSIIDFEHAIKKMFSDVYKYNRKELANVVITTHWTDGDVIPFIQIAKYLCKIGHHVTIITHCCYKERIEKEGISFAAWDTMEECQSLMQDMGRYEDNIAGRDEIKKFRQQYENLDIKYREFKIVEKYCNQPNTVLLAKNRSEEAALLVSEKYHIPIIWVYMNPYEYGSINNFELLDGKQLVKESNELRYKVGLERVNRWLDWIDSPKIKIGLWPKWFRTDSIGNDKQIKKIGFPSAIGKSQISGELMKILRTNPVIISGGTSRQLRSEFYEQAIRGCEEIGKNILVVTKYQDFLPDYMKENTYVVPYIPLQEALFYASFVIHHGGIGTISNAITAGIPQLVLADYVDRPLNGSIVKKLGLGEYLPPMKWDIQSIRESIGKISSGEYHATCREYAQIMQENTCLNQIEKLVDQASNNPDEYAVSYYKMLTVTNREKSSNKQKKREEYYSHMSDKTKKYLVRKALEKKLNVEV